MVTHHMVSYESLCWAYAVETFMSLDASRVFYHLDYALLDVDSTQTPKEKET